VALVERSPFFGSPWKRLGQVKCARAVDSMLSTRYTVRGSPWRHGWPSRRMNSHANGRCVAQLASPGWIGRHPIIRGNSGAKPAASALQHVEGAQQALAMQATYKREGAGRRRSCRHLCAVCASLSTVMTLSIRSDSIPSGVCMGFVCCARARHSWPLQQQKASTPPSPLAVALNTHHACS
jgi:hypothetical protein